jgi:hypothetical protein
MQTLTDDQLVMSTGGSRSDQCWSAWGNDLPSARADWGHVTPPYFNAVHPDPALCTKGKQAPASYYGDGAVARAATAGVPKYPVR